MSAICRAFHLTPIWIACRADVGLLDIGAEPISLGRRDSLGALDRPSLKQFSRISQWPDLGILKPRLIHAHFGNGGALAHLAIPLMVTPHGGDATKDKHYQKRLDPIIFARRGAALQQEAVLVICSSEHIRNMLISRGFPATKLKVIGYGTEPQIDSDTVPPTERHYLLSAGRFVEKKGIGYLLQAMRVLESEGVSVDLVSIGDGPMAEILKRESSGRRNARFLGWLPQQELRRATRGALAVCVPGGAARARHPKGLPNTVFEAMAAATVPVIGSNHGGIGKAVEHDRTGLLVPAAHPPAIAVQRLLHNPSLRHWMGLLPAHVAASEHFNADTTSCFLEDALLTVSHSQAA